MSESALRLAALALYITAIELNASPRPPKSLKFPRSLQDKVLFNVGRKNSEPPNGFDLGSLGPKVGEHFNGSFDLVIGNPPWTRLRAEKKEKDADNETEKERLKELVGKFTAITRQVLVARGLDNIAENYANPDNNPDLPFVWRAAEWAKPNGIIAMALPGRILLKQSKQGKAAPRADPGADDNRHYQRFELVRHKRMARDESAFHAFLWRNAVPRPEHGFYFATPVLERSLNDRGLFRIDYQAAEPVVADSVVEKPWLLKTLGIGTSLDVDVMDGVSSFGWEAIGTMWQPCDATRAASRQLLLSGTGFKLQPLKKKEQPSETFLNLPLFEEPKSGFRIAFANLKTFLERHGRIVPARQRDEPPLSTPVAHRSKITRGRPIPAEVVPFTGAADLFF